MALYCTVYIILSLNNKNRARHRHLQQWAPIIAHPLPCTLLSLHILLSTDITYFNSPLMWAFESCKIFPISPFLRSRRVRSNKIMVKSPEGRARLDWKLEIHLALDGSKWMKTSKCHMPFNPFRMLGKCCPFFSENKNELGRKAPDMLALARVPKNLLSNPCRNFHEFVFSRASPQDQQDILSVLENDIDICS